MVKMGRTAGYMRLLPAAVMAVVMTACASIGRIEGGPRDETPPVFVRSNPSPDARNVTDSRINIFFDENIQIKDVSSKVVVSPAQEQMPQIIAGGRRLSVELRDTLIPNTTYTIDFSDAISDLNEGNILDGFAMEFSTGETIDSLRVSGMLLEARTLEPAQGMLVGIHSNLSDTALSTIKLERIARTNQLGQFTIRGLKPGNYRVYAINDVNRDYKWNRGEDVAFYDYEVSPTVNNIIVTDTLLSSTDNDSIVSRPGVEYLPNDIFMTWFNENYNSQYLKNYSRSDSVKIELLMAAPSDSMPTLTIVGGPADGITIGPDNSVLEASAALDSLVYWITDPVIYNQDSLLIATRYLKTDSTDNLSWVNDTLKFNFKRPKQKKEKKKKNDEQDTIAPPIPLLDFQALGGSSQDLHKPMTFKSVTPVASINPDLIMMEQKVDTNWVKIKSPVIARDTLNQPLLFEAVYDWEPATSYRLTIDSTAVTGIYGLYNKKIVREFTTKALEDYSTVTFNLSDTTGVDIVVELLNTADSPIASVIAVDNKAYFPFLNEGTYYARAFIDRNGNGKWDTGNVADRLQPEEIFYYPKKVDLKKNWDVSQSWSLLELPADMQKPLAIKKNKPKKNTNDNLDGENENDEEDEWGTNFIPGSQYNDAQRTNSNNSTTNLRNNNNRRTR